VTLLNQGKAKEVISIIFVLLLLGLLLISKAIEVLESALQASPSTVVVAEPFLFNLCMCNRLRPLPYLSDYFLGSDVVRTQSHCWLRKEKGIVNHGWQVEWGWAEDHLLKDASKLINHI